MIKVTILCVTSPGADRKTRTLKYRVLWAPPPISKYIGPDGKLTEWLMLAQEFWGGDKEAKSAAREFASQHEFQLIK